MIAVAIVIEEKREGRRRNRVGRTEGLILTLCVNACIYEVIGEQYGMGKA